MSPIPAFNHSGVLPPYVGASPAGNSADMSPYRTTVDDVVSHFNTSADRRAVLQGFLRLRQQLRALNIVGWQWLDGSFLENIESLENRAPRDIDVVTFLYRPAAVREPHLWAPILSSNMHVFDPHQAKANFRCDARYVDLYFGPRAVVDLTRYWFGLFSHQRVTAVWKGMLEVELPAFDIDGNARALLGI